MLVCLVDCGQRCDRERAEMEVRNNFKALAIFQATIFRQKDVIVLTGTFLQVLFVDFKVLNEKITVLTITRIDHL